MGQNANHIDDAVYVLVLKKLKRIIASGYYGMDEVRYTYDWNEKQSDDLNLQAAAQEDAVLIYFINIGLIDGEHIYNEFRRQQYSGHEIDKRIRVWGEQWDAADAAYRLYGHIVRIYGVDINKLSSEAAKFGLVDAGAKLVVQKSSEKLAAVPLPKIILAAGGGFAVHDADLISYQGHIVVMPPQHNKVAAFIMLRAAQGSYTSIQAIIDECLTEQYLDKPSHTDDATLAYKYVRRCVSDARAAMRAVARTDPQKDYFPNKPGIGYIFTA